MIASELQMFRISGMNLSPVGERLGDGVTVIDFFVEFLKGALLFAVYGFGGWGQGRLTLGFLKGMHNKF